MFLALRETEDFLCVHDGASRGGIMERRRAAIRSDGVVPALAGADADDFLHVGDEDLPVADPARPRRLLDELDHLGDEVVRDDDLQFDLGRKSTTYSAPRYSSVWPFCRPNPLTSETVIP